MTVEGLDAERLSVAIVRHTGDHFVLIASDGTIVAFNQTLLETSGYRAADLLGRPVFDVIDPVDLERAVQLLPLTNDDGAPGGVSSFGIVRADGEVVTANVAADTVRLDDEDYILFRGRPVWFPQAMDRLLDGILGGAPLRDLFAQVPECLAWREDGSHVAICWEEEGGLRSVDTGLDARLVGADPEAEPWATLRAEGGSASGTVDELPEPLAAIASGLGITNWWIVAVDAPGGATPVVITVVGSRPGFPVTALHAAGMDMACRYTQLILRWTDQVARLEVAALHDPLTNLPNRRRFLEAIESGDGGGAVLYCDLDGFKPVNDRWGHAVGDEVLIEVGHRLNQLVRGGDLVARVGGDEFAVVLWGAGGDEADDVASRIREACRRPIPTSAGPVSIGISVGVATHDDRLHDDVVAIADAALYQDKAARQHAREGEPGPAAPR